MPFYYSIHALIILLLRKKGFIFDSMTSKHLRPLSRFIEPTKCLQSATTRTISTSASRRSLHYKPQPEARRTALSIFPCQPKRHTQIRWHSAPASKTHVYDFSSIKTLASKPSTDRILIDVREPSEYEPGHIPTSINIPLKSAPEAMLLPADEFEDRFGSEKPRADQEVVFYCKAGVRSSAAAKLAEQAGYERVGEYRGSWIDWEKNGGEVEK